MRTGKDLILATKAFVGDKPAYSWWLIGSTALGLAASLAGAMADLPWPARLGCSVLAGLFMVRFFVIYHDHQHKAILNRSKTADWLMKVWGVLAITPTSAWTHSHNQHHHHNSKLRGSNVGSFPIMTKDRYLEASRGERFRYLAARHPLTIALGYVTVFFGAMSVAPFLEDPKHHRDGLYALLAHIAIYLLVGLTLGASAVFFGLLLPFLVGCALGSYLFYAQHNFPAVTLKEADGWTYEGAALESSSHCVMSPLMRYFTGNIGFHHIHHLNAKIPFYRLPEAYRNLPELRQSKTTSLNPAEMLRCLRLKVWDHEQGRMIPRPKV